MDALKRFQIVQDANKYYWIKEILDSEPGLIQVLGALLKNRCYWADSDFIFRFHIDQLVLGFVITYPFFDNWNNVKIDVVQGDMIDLSKSYTFEMWSFYRG